MQTAKFILLRLFFAGLLFVFLQQLFSAIILASFSRLILDVEPDHADIFAVYFSARGQFTEKQVALGSLINKGERKKEEINLAGHVARRLRIDPGSQTGVVRIYGLQLTSYFAKPIILTPAEIFADFTANADISSFRLQDTHVEIIASGNDPFLQGKRDFQHHNTTYTLFLPLLFSLLVFSVPPEWLAFWKKLPLLNDLRLKTSSMGMAIGALDGLRGVAALTVLAEHTGILSGAGSFGVYLFFALSGFLLATPFVYDPAKAVDLPYLRSYLLRRLKRILPLYYLFITMTMMIHGHVPAALRHYFFLQGDGHLWTLPQEMFFYLILPLVVVSLYYLGKLHRFLPILALLLYVWLANTHLSMRYISFYGYGTTLPSRAGVFLGGVFFAYFLYWLYQEKMGRHLLAQAWFRQLCSVLGLLLLVGLLFFSTKTVSRYSGYSALYHSGVFGFLGGALIMLAVIASKTPLGWLMNSSLLRVTGLCGFSFYLLHPLVLSVLTGFSREIFDYRFHNAMLFVLTAIGTLLFSSITYCYIERPFLHTTRTVSQTETA